MPQAQDVPELVHQRALLLIPVADRSAAWISAPTGAAHGRGRRRRAGAAERDHEIHARDTKGLARRAVVHRSAGVGLVAEDRVAVDVVANAVEIRGPQRKETRAGIAGRAVEVDDRVAGFRDSAASAEITESTRHRVDARSDDVKSGQDAIERPNVHVQLDAGRSVQIRDGRIGERLYQALNRRLNRRVSMTGALQVVELEEQILTESVRTQCRKIDIGGAVVVGVVAVGLPDVEQPVIVRIDAVGRRRRHDEIHLRRVVTAAC